MRRIDILIIGFGIFGAGGLIYLLFQVFGLEANQAGIWSQVLLITGVILWISTYLFRVFTHKMTYHQQLKDYEEAVIQKRFEEMTDEEIAQLQAEIDQENS
jgi:formate hydrogenlyase subunit 3/multisubunit Na+/H+ antiporter MnhD subunit